MSHRFLALAALILLSAGPAMAQQGVTLRFQDGLVTLRANNAPVRTILTEWARLGGATIVNGDRVVGPPLTIELADVPERQALDIVLRNVAGYMLAPRRAGSQAASAFDRILILPTSVAPRNPPPAPTPTAGAPRPVLPRPGMLPRSPVAQADQGEALQPEPGAEIDPDPVNPGEQQPPRPGLPPLMRRPPVPTAAEPQGGDDDPDPAATPPPPAVGPTPANPFGVPVGSSTTPGVVAPLPRPTQGQQTTPNRVQ